MMTPAFYRGLLLGTALIAGMPLSAAAKCASPPDGGRLVPSPIAIVIDGHQHSKAELESRTTLGDSIQAIHILCWKSADSTFSSSPGTAGVSVIRIVTRALVDRLVDALDRVSASPASGQSTERGATDQEVVVALSADKTKWSATITRGAMVHQCVMDVGGPSLATPSDVRRIPAGWDRIPTGWNPHPTADCSFTIAAGEKHTLSAEG
jgi:hypothetical protein